MIHLFSRHSIFIVCILTSSCINGISKDDSIQDDYACKTQVQQNKLSRLEFLSVSDRNIIEGLARIDTPDPSGAMGRNKAGYFHVRFQMGISAQADLAISTRGVEALDNTIRAIEYAFKYQQNDGGFEYKLPQEFTGQIPKEVDLASGVSFFLSSLGLALNTLEESGWYHQHTISGYKNRIDALRPKIEFAAVWLLDKKELLSIADVNAPNRLLFNALAYYSLGKWLHNTELMATGIYFAELAIQSMHPNGYFIEGGGWDSSYQGVAINVGLNLYMFIPESEPLKHDLWNSLSCATDWQRSRVLTNGEISTQGNTRVFPGGEGFLGVEKSMDWIDTMTSFLVMYFYTGNVAYNTLAYRIKDFYY